MFRSFGRDSPEERGSLMTTQSSFPRETLQIRTTLSLTWWRATGPSPTTARSTWKKLWNSTSSAAHSKPIAISCQSLLAPWQMVESAHWLASKFSCQVPWPKFYLWWQAAACMTTAVSSALTWGYHPNQESAEQLSRSSLASWEFALTLLHLTSMATVPKESSSVPSFRRCFPSTCSKLTNRILPREKMHSTTPLNNCFTFAPWAISKALSFSAETILTLTWMPRTTMEELHCTWQPQRAISRSFSSWPRKTWKKSILPIDGATLLSKTPREASSKRWLNSLKIWVDSLENN